MWTVLNKQVCVRKTANLVELHQFCQEEWLNIQPEDNQKLVDAYQKHLIEVKMVKGLTKLYVFLSVNHRNMRAVEVIGTGNCHDVHESMYAFDHDCKCVQYIKSD